MHLGLWNATEKGKESRSMEIGLDDIKSTRNGSGTNETQRVWINFRFYDHRGGDDLFYSLLTSMFLSIWLLAVLCTLCAAITKCCVDRQVIHVKKYLDGLVVKMKDFYAVSGLEELISKLKNDVGSNRRITYKCEVSDATDATVQQPPPVTRNTLNVENYEFNPAASRGTEPGSRRRSLML